MIFLAGDARNESALFTDTRYSAFFFASALMAVIGPLVVVLSVSGLISFESAYGPFSWHGHEMFYGYLGAIFTGFFLVLAHEDAVPQKVCMLLMSLWLIGRIAMAASEFIGMELTAFLDVLFPLYLITVTLPALLKSKSQGSIFLIVVLVLFVCGNLLWHVRPLAVWGVFFSLAAVTALLVLVAGRVIPIVSGLSISENEKGASITPGVVDKLSVFSVVAAFFAMGLMIAGQGMLVAGLAFMAATFLNGARLIRWRGWRFYNEPQILIFHIAYLWIVVSFFLLGLVYLGLVEMAFSTAMHAFVGGAAGVVALAMMVQAYNEKYGPLSRGVITLLYTLVNIGAVLRVSAEWVPLDYSLAISLAGAIWSSAFLLFVVIQSVQFLQYGNSHKAISGGYEAE